VNPIFWHALVFGLAPLLQKIAGMVLLPLYTHYLTAADYGEIELVSIATGLVGVLMRLEARPGYLRAWTAETDAGGHARLFTGMLVLLALTGTIGTAAFLAFSGPLCDALLGYRLGWGYRLVLAAGMFADVVLMLCSATLQARLQSGRMVALGLAQFVVGAGLTVLCVAGLRTGPIGFFVGGTAASLFGLVVMLAALRRLLTRPREAWAASPLVADVVRYSLPLLCGALLYFVVRNADRLAVGRLMSVADLGIYAMAWTLANLLLTMMLAPLQASYDVWRYRLHRDGGRLHEVAAFFRHAMLAVAAAAIVLDTVGADVFVFLADPRFAAAVTWLPALSVAVLLQAGYTFLAAAFYVSGATGTWLVLFACGAATQVALSVALVPWLGIAGAVCGILAANGLLYAGAAVRGARLWPVPYRHGPVVALCVLLFACASLRAAFAAPNWAAALAADALACAAFGACALLLRLVSLPELARMTRMLRGRVAARLAPR
jgi:O-antigen/teichoic acid export membrane protein